MNYDQAIRRLTSYLDGESPPDERDAVAEHIEACPGCREALEALRGTLSAVDAWKVEGGDIVNAVVAQIALETSASEDANPSVLALLHEMRRELRELREEVAALRAERAAQKGAPARMTGRMSQSAPLGIGLPNSPGYRMPRTSQQEKDPWNCGRS
jgi:anti-sigma factor RsiW